MKRYIHARLTPEDAEVLQELKRRTGQSESQILRRGLRLIRETLSESRSALHQAGASAGKFTRGPHDLSTNKKYLDGFGR